MPVYREAAWPAARTSATSRSSPTSTTARRPSSTRFGEVVDEVYELFLDLDADESQIDFPIVYTNAKAGWASLDPAAEGEDLGPLLDLLLEHVPAPEHDPTHPLQAHVTNLDASPY